MENPITTNEALGENTPQSEQSNEAKIADIERRKQASLADSFEKGKRNIS